MELDRPLVLASGSPRRKYLMEEAGFRFRVETPGVEEIIPTGMPVEEVARYLATVKAEAFRRTATEEIVVTADTVVILNDTILNKPADRAEAIAMLTALSGNTHRVMTGVTILTAEDKYSFDDSTDVTFEKLSREDIEFYIDRFHPYDKAGSYGAQDSLPVGMNPCSPEERLFLRNIGREDLMEEAMATDEPRRLVLIRKIEGSYFNVMGLPIHRLYDYLRRYS